MAFPGLLLVQHGRRGVDDPAALAWAYGEAAQRAIRFALENLDMPEAAFPALFLVRHTVELHLKRLIPDWASLRERQKGGHAIDRLIEVLRDRLGDRFDAAQIEEMAAFLLRFHDLDPKAMAFRFTDGATATWTRPDQDLPDPEVWIDLRALAASAEILFEALGRLDHVLLYEGVGGAT